MRRILSFILLFGTPSVLFAQASQGTVNLLVQDLPIIGSATNLADFLKGVFRLSLGIAVTAAIVIIVWNGFRYMTTDIVNSKDDAKKWIGEALWGLVLAFSAVLILSTINPDLTKFKFLDTLREVGDQSGQPGGGGGGGEEEPPEPEESQEVLIRRQLQEAGIYVNKPACAPGQTTNCTNVDGLPQSAIGRLIAIKEACACGNFTITGGTEPGHQTHGVGRPIMDLRRDSNITRFIQTNGVFLRDTSLGKLYRYNGSEFLDETNGDGAPHWHACIGTTCSIAN